jgi:hypothetical protein
VNVDENLPSSGIHFESCLNNDEKKRGAIETSESSLPQRFDSLKKRALMDAMDG